MISSLGVAGKLVATHLHASGGGWDVALAAEFAHRCTQVAVPLEGVHLQRLIVCLQLDRKELG